MHRYDLYFTSRRYFNITCFFSIFILWRNLYYLFYYYVQIFVTNHSLTNSFILSDVVDVSHLPGTNLLEMLMYNRTFLSTRSNRSGTQNNVTVPEFAKKAEKGEK